MSTTAKALLDAMTVRLRMQQSGVTSLPQRVQNLTKSLVEQVASFPPDEPIQILVIRKRPLHTEYIRERTGQILAEIDEESLAR